MYTHIKFYVLGFLLSLTSCQTQRQSVQTQSSSDVLKKYIEQISQTAIQESLTIIASDTMQGRHTGSLGQQKTATYIVQQFQKAGISYPPKAKNWFQNIPSSFLHNGRFPASDNIWAFVEGSEKPEEVLVISAHYDHIGMENGKIYNGADDNASGTAAVIEMARVFAKATQEGHRPKRSILFLLVTAEEIGLLGSDYYTQNPLYPLQNTIANINIDMVGRIDYEHADENYIYVIGSDRLSTELHDITEKTNEKYTHLTLDYKYNERDEPMQVYYRSDHYNFAKYGIPSVFFFNGLHDDYHKETDTTEKINFEALLKRTRLIFALAWELANRDKRITVDRDGQ